MASTTEPTIKEFLTEILEICEANPDKINPVEGQREVCVYEDADGNHCLIGEWLDTKGMLGKAAAYGNEAAAGLLQLLGYSPRLAEVADNVQCWADTGRKPWGEVGSMIRLRCAEYLEEEMT